MAAKQHRRSEAGFTLIELMISMGIILTITVAAFSLMDGAMRTSATFYEQTEAQQNLRIVQEYINRDLTDAGSKLTSISGGQLRVPLDFTQNYISANPVGTVTTGPASNHFVRLPLVTSDNNVPAALSGVLTGTDRITTIKIDEDPAFPLSVPAVEIDCNGVLGLAQNIVKPNSNTFRVDLWRFDCNSVETVNEFHVGEIFLFNSSDSQNAALGVVTAVTTGSNASVTFAGGDAYGLNKNGVPHLTVVPYPSGYAGNARANSLTISRIEMVTYFVDADGLLRRRVLGRVRNTATPVTTFIDNARAGEVIAEHFTDLQFRYEIIDANNSNLWQTVDSLTVLQQPQVRLVEFKAEAETTRAVGVLRDAANNYGKVKTASTTRTSVRNLADLPNAIRF